MVPDVSTLTQSQGVRKRPMTWLWIVLGVAGAIAAVVLVLGLMNPAGHIATVRASYARPPAELFAAISDHAGQTQWRKDLRSLEMLPPQDGKTVFRETGGFGPVTYVVEASEPPRHYVVRILDKDLPYEGKWNFELESIGDVTRLTITETGSVKVFLFRALSPFFSKTATIEGYLRALGAKFGETIVPEVVQVL